MIDGVRRLGVLAATAAGHPHRRTRAVLAADHAAMARQLFLAGAVRLGAPAHLRRPISAADLAARLGVVPGARLDAWLALGVAVGELRRRGDRYVAHGHRARALADGDRVVTAWFDTLLGFGVGIPTELPELLAGTTDRRDLADADADIAAIAELADPLARPVLAEALDATAARSLLDVGCGDGRLLAWARDRRPALRATGVDQAPGALAAAAERFAGHHGPPVALVAGRLAEAAAALGTFDVVSSANAVYYQPPDELPAQVAELAALVAPGGELVVATAVAPTGRRSGPAAPVAVASALLDLQLRCQAGHLRLPTATELDAAVAATGLEVVGRHQALPGLPYLALRARRR